MKDILIFKRVLAVFVLVYALVACSETDTSSEAENSKSANNALMLMFEDSEPGVDPYTTRILINDKYMRLDDGTDTGDFALLDRAENTIYNVANESKNILVIKKQPIKLKSPIKLTMDAKKSVDTNAPKIAGMDTLRYELMVNDIKCASIVVVPGMLPQALEAMREFQRALAGTHAKNLAKTPAEMIDTCFLAHDVFAPVRTLQYGFPIHQQDNSGNARTLVNYNESFKDVPGLYELPKDYRRTQMSGGI